MPEQVIENPLKGNAKLSKGDRVLNTGWSICDSLVLICVPEKLNRAEEANRLNAVKLFFARMNRVLANMVEVEKQKGRVEKPPEPVVTPEVVQTPELHL